MREEEKNQSSRKIGIQRFFKKRWVYPAIYIGAAAIILTSFLWFQSRGENVNPNDFGYETNPDRKIAENDAQEVNKQMENFEWPVTNVDAVEVKTPFYDPKASKEEQEAALVSYGNSYQPNTGIDIVAKNGESFDVVAAMSGTVKSVEEDSLLGNVIVIEHADGIETRYQSVQDIQVKTGDKVKQGQVLAKAGRSMLNEEAGIHTHFEIRKNNVAVNPLEYFKKSLTSLLHDSSSEKTGEADDSSNSDERSKQDDANKPKETE